MSPSYVFIDFISVEGVASPIRLQDSLSLSLSISLSKHLEKNSSTFEGHVNQVNVFPSQKGQTFHFISFYFLKYNLFILFIFFFSMIPARKNHRKNEKNEKNEK